MTDKHNTGASSVSYRHNFLVFLLNFLTKICCLKELIIVITRLTILAGPDLRIKNTGYCFNPKNADAKIYICKKLKYVFP